MATPHNNAPQGAYAKTVLMPGDPLRAKYVAENFLQDAVEVNNVRGCLGYTGTYRGHRVSVQASGMGQPSIGIYCHELYTQYGVENIIRIGSAGSYTDELKVMDVVLADSAYSETSFAKVHNGYPDSVNYPDAELNTTILKCAEEARIPVKLTRVHSSDVFYTDPSQGTYQDLAERSGAGCVEMESFALFHIAKYLGKRAACVLTISDSFVSHEELPAEERQKSFRQMMTIALDAAVAME